MVQKEALYLSIYIPVILPDCVLGTKAHYTRMTPYLCVGTSLEALTGHVNNSLRYIFE